MKTEEYNNNIPRSEICDMFAAAIPEEHFAPINDVKGIPDVLRDSVNADVYLTFYKAGVLLGDEKGNFNPDSDIKRSEIAAIINRVALPENRVKGTISGDPLTPSSEFDLDFDDAETILDGIPNGLLIKKISVCLFCAFIDKLFQLFIIYIIQYSINGRYRHFRTRITFF